MLPLFVLGPDGMSIAIATDEDILAAQNESLVNREALKQAKVSLGTLIHSFCWYAWLNVVISFFVRCKHERTGVIRCLHT